jgi:hypothetical protein
MGRRRPKQKGTETEEGRLGKKAEEADPRSVLEAKVGER